MALIKTNYGLRYNDDGSLCMTIRQDDVPFPGVDSWAVEEGTTNIVSNPMGSSIANPTPGAHQPGWDTTLHNDAITVYEWSSGYNPGVEHPEKGYHAKWVYEGINGNNDPCMKFIDHNELYGMSHRWLGISQIVEKGSSLGWAAGDTITISWYQKSDVLGKGANVGLWHKESSSGEYHFYGCVAYIPVTTTNKWERASFTITISDDWVLDSDCTLYIYGDMGAYGTLWVDNVQVEKKPYATSFVDGTRDGGKFWIPFNYSQNNLVFEMWAKYNLYNKENIFFQLGTVGTARLTAAYARIFNIDDSNKLSNIWYTTIEKEWYHYVFVRDELTIKAYVNGVSVGTNVINTSTYNPVLFVGNLGVTGYYVNGLISNFYVGHYRDKNGNVIWTDDYIKYVYEQKKPFAAHYNIID